MLQSTVRGQNKTYQGESSYERSMQSSDACGDDVSCLEEWRQGSSPTQYPGTEAAASAPQGASLPSARQKTMYKLVDTEAGLFCQGGAWPCSWDSAGRTWANKNSLRRYLRSVLARGYHLKPRAVPPHWKIVEIEEVVSYYEKALFPADQLISSQ